MKDYLEKVIRSKQEEIKEVEERVEKSDDVQEVRALGETLKKLRDELNDAEKQLSQVDKEEQPKEEEQQQEEPKEEQQGQRFNPVATYGLKRGKTMEQMENFEYRNAFMDFVLNKKPIPTELRANTLTDDVAAAIPVEVMNRIVEGIAANGMILPLVTRTNYKGGLSIPTSSVRPVATWVAEGAGSDRQKKVLGEISFTHFKLRCEVSMSMETSVMTIPVFEQVFIANVVDAMSIALEKSVIAGTGTGMPTGILSQDAPEGQTITLDGEPTFSKLVEAEGALPIEYENTAKWVMTKKAWAKVEGMVDDNKQPIARVNYGLDGRIARVFCGREVVLIPYAEEMGDNFAFIYDFKDYVLNTIYDMGIQRKQDWDTEDQRIKAVMSVDGKPVSNASLVLVKGTAESE